MGIKRIRRAIREERYEFTIHALEEMDDDDLDEADVRYAVLHGEISSELTDDPRGIRFVVLGNASDKNPFVRSCLSVSANGFIAYNYRVSN